MKRLFECEEAAILAFGMAIIQICYAVHKLFEGHFALGICLFLVGIYLIHLLFSY